MAKLGAIRQHDGGSSTYTELLFAELCLSDNCIAGEASLQILCYPIHIKPCGSGQVDEDLATTDVQAVSKERASDAEIEVQEQLLALLSGAPGCLKRRQGRR